IGSIIPAKPDAIVQVSAYRSCAAFVRAARHAGFSGMFCNVSFVGTQALASELGSDARGVVVSQVMPCPYSPTTAIGREYVAAGRSSVCLRRRLARAFGDLAAMTQSRQGVKRMMDAWSASASASASHLLCRIAIVAAWLGGPAPPPCFAADGVALPDYHHTAW